MMHGCMRAGLHAWVLAAGCLCVTPVWAQGTAASEPAASEPSAAATQSATAPQAYHIKLNSMLVYQVIITAKMQQGPGPMEKIDRRELAVFDIEPDGALVVYVGAPKDSRPIGALLTSQMSAAPQPTPVPRPTPNRNRESRENRSVLPVAPPPAPTPPPSAETKPDKPRHIEMTWTRHVVGRPERVESDGTVVVRPAATCAAYPVLPLPAEDVKEKERFDVTVPDIAAGGGDKTLDLIAHWAPAGPEKVAISARLDAKFTPGMTPELATFGYDVARNEPAAVSRITEMRKLSAEVPSPQPAAERGGDAPRTTPNPGGHREHGAAPSPAPRPALPPKPAAPSTPMVSVLIFLDKTMPLAEAQRKALIAMTSKGGSDGEGEKPAAKEAAPAGDLEDLVNQVQTWEQNTREQMPKAP